MNRTIKELAKKNGRVYVYLEDANTGNQFMKQAQDEGFTFADGVKPAERCYAEIMAVNRDATINFVGMNGRIAFGSGAKTIGGEELIRVDYKRYIAGNKDYNYYGKTGKENQSMTLEEMKNNIENDKLKLLVEVLEKRYGNLDDDRGCNINRQWFSPKDILNIIIDVDNKD